MRTTKEAIKSPYFGILYSKAGAGKSFLCSYIPRAIFLATEKGCEKVPAEKIINDDGSLFVPSSLKEFREALKFLLDNENITAIGYDTIVIDSAKFLDILMSNDVLVNRPTKINGGREVAVTSIDGYDFGYGYGELMARWQRFLIFVAAAKDKGINVILIAHSIETTVSDGTNAPYKKVSIDLSEFGKKSVVNLVAAAADWVVYLESHAKTTLEEGFMKKLVTKPMAGIDNLATGDVHNNSLPVLVAYTRDTNRFFAKVRATDFSKVKDFYVVDYEDKSTVVALIEAVSNS